jgi:hypothetical protein
MIEGKMSVSIIVPTYDDEYDIVPSLSEIFDRMLYLVARKLINDFELIVFLRDKDFSKLSSFMVGKKEINWICRGDDRELGSMFARGIRLARMSHIGLITPYRQVDLEIFQKVVEAFKSNDNDIVVTYIGNNFARPWYRGVASLSNTLFVNLLFGLKLKYYHLNFYRTSLVKKMSFTTKSHAAMVEAAVWTAKSGAKTAQIPFTMIFHNFKSKSRAFRIKNLVEIFKTYIMLFWRIRILHLSF